MTDFDGFVHAMSVVDRTARIGARTKVWQFASVIRGAVIGPDCVIGACSIVDGATLGFCCHVGHGAQLHPGFRAAAGVFVGPGAVVCNDAWPSTVKRGFDLEALRDRPCVVAEPGASIGANAVILPGVRLGARSLVAAGAVCERDVPADMLLTREGTLRPIPANVADRRMRFVEEAVAAC